MENNILSILLSVLISIPSDYGGFAGLFSFRFLFTLFHLCAGICTYIYNNSNAHFNCSAARSRVWCVCRPIVIVACIHWLFLFHQIFYSYSSLLLFSSLSHTLTWLSVNKNTGPNEIMNQFNRKSLLWFYFSYKISLSLSFFLCLSCLSRSLCICDACVFFLSFRTNSIFIQFNLAFRVPH